GAALQKINPSYSATARYFARYPFGVFEWNLKYGCPLKSTPDEDTRIRKSILKGLVIELLKQGKYKEAEDAFNKEIQVLDDGDACLSYSLALAQAGAGHYKDAEVTILRIVPSQSSNSIYFLVQLLLGDVFFDQGKFPDAERTYRKILD